MNISTAIRANYIIALVYIKKLEKEILKRNKSKKKEYVSKLESAELYAKSKHKNMTRKDGITPYSNHLEEVVSRLKSLGITDEDVPVILDLESIRAVGEGKFEIDVVNLFNRKRPIIYKMEEGKYIIDLAPTLDKSVKDVGGIRKPYKN